MATQTTNLHLVKPAYADVADIAVLNGNSDIIDGVIGGVTMGTTANTLTGAIAEHEQDIISANEAIATIQSNHGLDLGTIIPKNSNFNDYTTPGRYYVPDSSYAATNSNMPTTAAGGTLDVVAIVATSNYFRQVYTMNSGTSLMFVRNCTNGTFSPWRLYGYAPLRTATAFSIPASGSSVTKSMNGITANYMLTAWNFSGSPENKPPADLTWTTGDGTFTITNNGGTTSETIRPVFTYIYDMEAT